jgi:hypothetical protein
MAHTLTHKITYRRYGVNDESVEYRPIDLATAFELQVNDQQLLAPIFEQGIGLVINQSGSVEAADPAEYPDVKGHLVIWLCPRCSKQQVGLMLQVGQMPRLECWHCQSRYGFTHRVFVLETKDKS